MKTTESNTNPAPTIKGVLGRYHSASFPERNGAIVPPRKRKKLYAAEAVDRSTGAAFMTAVVMSVLLLPNKAPAIITAAITTHWVDVQIPIASRRSANRINIIHIDLTVPNHCCSFGAMKTEVRASNIPQPRKT